MYGCEELTVEDQLHGHTADDAHNRDGRQLCVRWGRARLRELTLLFRMYKRREYLNTLDKRHHTREITDK